MSSFDADSTNLSNTWDRITPSGIVANISKMSLDTLKKEIERTWYFHIELRNELYELDMGPIGILEVFVSCQKTIRPPMTRDEVAALMESNFYYHMELRHYFYKNIHCCGSDIKQTYM